jgi:hypothetical protein
MTPALTATVPAVSADSAASSTSAAAAALTSAVAHPSATVGPAAAPAAGTAAEVSVASALSNDPFDLSLPVAASIADKDFAELRRKWPERPPIKPTLKHSTEAFHERMGMMTAKTYAPRSAAAETLRAENLARGRANLSDSDTEASTAYLTAGRGRRSPLQSLRRKTTRPDLTRV